MMSITISPEVTVFFESTSNTVTSVVCDPTTSKVAIIDSVLNFEYTSGRTSTTAADEIIEFIRANNYEVEWVLETHAHADHLSAAPYLKRELGGKIAIGEHIKDVQNVFGEVFKEGELFLRDGSQFDHLFRDGETFKLGEITVEVFYTPGHTPACVSYLAGDALFVGDTLFMPDFGTARCDFPGGSAETLYRSVQRLLTLPDETRMFVGHDYKAEGRDLYAWETTVGEQRTRNVHVGIGQDIETFIKMRIKRDATLNMPRLIVPAIQVNIRAGNMPEPDPEGRIFLKVPVNVL
jgi:glyoxylase-like metal-dependent hydrolase (beta-lactamase superfamily II)